MKCNRCCSEMVYEKFYGFQEHFWGWRCIFCGEIVDQVILENRGFLATGCTQWAYSEEVKQDSFRR